MGSSMGCYVREGGCYGEKPKAPHPTDFPQGGEKPPHIISIISIWVPTKGPIWANHNNDA